MKVRRGKKQETNFFRYLLLKSNKGLSNIIATLIMIILVLVAIGIIWISISSIIESGTYQIELGAKCLSIDIRTTKLECGGADNDVCNVTVRRSAGGDEIAGIKLIFTNLEGETNYIHDVSGNIVPLETKTELNVDTGIVNTNSVDVVSYFKDSSGNEQLCSITNTFNS